MYCLCRCTAVLNLAVAELQPVAAYVGACLRSTHRFVRNAALRGLLALLESYAASNTAIGRLSDELALVRQLAVAYTQHWTGGGAAPPLDVHGTAAESDEHARLVWSVTWYVVETTSKFCPDCGVLGEAVMAAAVVLRRMGNVDLYTAILSVSAHSGTGVKWFWSLGINLESDELRML